MKSNNLTIIGRLLAFIFKYVRLFIFRILQKGPIPKHVAFIMDGNRRFASRHGLPTKFEGHIHGSYRLEQVLEWCFELGVQAVTVYAFSIENFRRSAEEVDAIMRIAKEKFQQLGQHSDIINRHEVAIQIIGELELLPSDVREAALDVMRRTGHHRRFLLNICFPYTATAELVSIFNDLHRKGIPITRESISSRIYTNPAPPLDLLVRTSGEHRLSEFLTWQMTEPRKHRPCLIFLDTLWPDFSFLNYLYVLLRYQRYRQSRQNQNDTSSLAKVELPTPPVSPIYNHEKSH